MTSLALALRPRGHTRSQVSLATRAVAAIRRAGGTVLQSGLIRNYFDSAGTTPATVDNPVGLVQDSVGSSHATQATVGSKPTLRRDANGRYYWQFDPAAPGDYLQTSITTGNEGWICAGVTFGAAPGSALQLAGTTANGGLDGSGILVATGGASVLMSVGTGSAQHFATRTAPTLGAASVVDGGWNSSSVFVATNGAETSAARSGTATSPGTLTIGARQTAATAWLNGSMPAIVYCPTLPSAADRTLIRRWVGSLQGQTL